MAEMNTIGQVLAALILRENVPLQAVALAGEMITLDARLSDYHPGAENRSSLENLSLLGEANEELLRRTRAAADDFSRTRDGHALIRTLVEIKEKLAAL
jgi:hypothetical protein